VVDKLREVGAKAPNTLIERAGAQGITPAELTEAIDYFREHRADFHGPGAIDCWIKNGNWPPALEQRSTAPKMKPRERALDIYYSTVRQYRGRWDQIRKHLAERLSIEGLEEFIDDPEVFPEYHPDEKTGQRATDAVK